MNEATFDTQKIFPQVKKVELREEGANITMSDGSCVYMNQDQICKIWGMITLALDCACFGELSSKIRRLGITDVMMNALHGIKTFKDEDSKQVELDLEFPK